MTKLKTIAAVSTLTMAVGLAAPSALARPYAQGYNAYAEVPGHIGSSNRAAALQTCNGKSAKFKNYTWGDHQAERYRACMAEHGQPE
jgi:hypothetical protein